MNDEQKRDKLVIKKSAMSAGALMALVGGLLTGGELMGQTPIAEGQRTIRASGVGEYRVQPDLATIHFAVETTGRTAQEAGEANADAMDRVIQALVGAGVRREDIRTSGYALFPEYAIPPRGAENEPPVIRGYRASNQVAVRSRDIEGLGRLIDVGLQAGANRLNGVNFEVENGAEAEAEALRRAVQSARRSAETIAGALGVQLGALLDASTNAEPIQPMYRAVAMEAFDMSRAGMAAPTPIEPGEQTVRATASVVFAIQ